jgi:23S rRNA (cytosine1962-C5)-methyltransferase
MLLSAHTPGFSPVVLANVLTQAIDGLGGGIASGEMILTGAWDVLPLPSGAFARWDSRAAAS